MKAAGSHQHLKHHVPVNLIDVTGMDRSNALAFENLWVTIAVVMSIVPLGFSNYKPTLLLASSVVKGSNVLEVESKLFNNLERS